MKNVPRLYFFFRFWTFIFVQISKAEIFVEQTPSKTHSLPFCSEMLKIADLVCYHHFFETRRGGLEDGNGGNEKSQKIARVATVCLVQTICRAKHVARPCTKCTGYRKRKCIGNKNRKKVAKCRKLTVIL